VLRIINEPTAAALAYGLDKTKPHHRCTTSAAGTFRHVQFLESGDGVVRVKSMPTAKHFWAAEDFGHADGSGYLADEFQKEQGIIPVATTSWPCSA